MDAPIPALPSQLQKPKDAKTRRRQRHWFLFRVLSILLGITPFLVAEALLRLFGFGYDLSLITPIPDSPGWYQLNPRFDAAFFGTTDLQGPEYRPFRLPKPPGVRRILVVGGSTVAGYPYASELAFSRHLEAQLNAQGDGKETIEVLNAGITAISSSTEVAVVSEGLNTDPDVIVVYSGHNEFYGAGGVALSIGVLSPGWHRFAAVCRRLRIVQLVSRLVKARKPSVDLIEWLPGDQHIRLESETFHRGLSAFQQNTNDMAELAGKAGIPIVFVSPVANEHDQPPIESQPSNPGADGESRAAMLSSAERELSWGDLSKALEQLESASLELDGDPKVQFRLAQAYEKAGRIEQSAQRYARALELDGCRFRAPAAFRSVVADVAKKHQQTRASFVDLYKAICDDSPLAVPGQKHFLEHVHFTWEGNRLVGSEIAKSIWSETWSREWSEPRVLDDQMARERLAVVDEDHIAAIAMAMGFFAKAPFRDGVDAKLLANDLARESANLFQRLPAEQQRRFMERARQRKTLDTFGALIESRISISNDELTENWLKARVVRTPWCCDCVVKLAEWLTSHGKADEATKVRNVGKNWSCRL